MLWSQAMSHHGREEPKDERDASPKRKMLLEAARKAQLRMQGEFPDGRLNAADEGMVSVVIGHEKGSVGIAFPHPTKWVAFTPKQAIDIAQSLIRHAEAASGRPLPQAGEFNSGHT
jgi:hypothetical protein